MVDRFAATVLAVFSLAIAGPVLVAGAVDMASSIGAGAPVGGGFGRRLGVSLACAGGVALLATVAGCGLALVTRLWPVRLLALVLLPLLLPQYLAFAGWGVLLDPSTALGDWLARRSAASDVAIGLHVRRALALVTLGVWAAPLAWLVVVVSLRRVERDVADALRLEPLSPWGRARATLATVRPAVLLALGLVFVVMLGSAVPLDLAQIDTLGNDVRLRLSLGDRAGAWARGAALVAPGVLLAAVLGVALSRESSGGGVEPVRTRRSGWLALGGLLGVAIGAPLAVSLANLRDAGAPWRFLERQGGALFDSLLTAGLVGLAGAGLAWAAATCRLWSRRWTLLGSVVLLAMTALTPGVLVGAAWVRTLSADFMPQALLDTRAGLALGHLARFGVAAVLGGLWLGSLDPQQLRDAARQDGADRLAGHLLADLPRLAGPLAGLGLVLAALSLHEIEATVLLAPAGSDSLSRRLLEMLHYQRRDDLMAGVAIVGATTLALASGAVGLAGLADPRRWRNRKGGHSL